MGLIDSPPGRVEVGLRIRNPLPPMWSGYRLLYRRTEKVSIYRQTEQVTCQAQKYPDNYQGDNHAKTAADPEQAALA